MLEDSEGLHEIANTADGLRKADIVFVHGLGGKSHETWLYKGRTETERLFWPAELGKDMPDCGIWTVGYPAGLTASFGSPGMAIELRAGNLAQKLANAGVGHRPLVFVTHSMGGLVVKTMLVGSQLQADKDRKQVTSQTRGVAFCGTPHRGADLANAASVLGVFFGGAQGHLEEMKSGQVALNTLHDQFIEWQSHSKMAVCSYAENIGLFRKGIFRPAPLPLVVPLHSANPGIQGHTVRVVDEDHLSLVKPKNRESDVYAGVLRFIRECLANETNDVAETSATVKTEAPRKATELASGDPGDPLETLSRLTPKQRELVRFVAKHRQGVHVTDLSEALQIGRSEAVYRVRELVGQGLFRTQSLTDLLVELSEALESRRKAAPSDFSQVIESTA